MLLKDWRQLQVHKWQIQVTLMKYSTNHGIPKKYNQVYAPGTLSNHQYQLVPEHKHVQMYL